MAFTLQGKTMFPYQLANRFQNILNHRLRSASNYGEYIRFLADTGNLGEMIASLQEIEQKKTLFDNFEQYLQHDVVKRMLNFCNKHVDKKIEFSQIKNVNDLQVYLVHHQFSCEIYDKFIQALLPYLNPTQASHEQTMIYGYVINLALDYGLVKEQDCEKLCHFLYAAKNTNKLRTDHCLIRIMQYAVEKKYSTFFKIIDKYNHFQRIMYAIQSTHLLEKEEKRNLQLLFFKGIKANNSFALKKPKKVAVCISGMFRGHEQSLKEIKENIVEPLGADVFMHTWDMQADWPGIGGTASFFRLFGHENEKKIPEEYRGVNGILKIEQNFPRLFKLIQQPILNSLNRQKILSYFPNAKLSVENQQEFERNIISKIPLAKTLRYKNQLKMIYGIQQAFKLAFDASTHYDFMIRIRPDVQVAQFNTDVVQQAQDQTFYGLTEHYVGPTDVEFLCSSKMAYSFVDFADQCFQQGRLNPYTDLPDTDAHRLMLLWLIANDFSIGDDVIHSKILDSQHFKDFPNLQECLNQDIYALNDEQIAKDSGLIEFFRTFK